MQHSETAILQSPVVYR